MKALLTFSRLKRFFLVLIIGLAFVMRFYHVTANPPALNWDEVSIGYNAYSILKTGRDEWGQFLPLHFKSYGEYKLPAQIYASIPAIWLFGLNDFAVRITPVIYGTITIWLLYLLARKLFKSEVAALISSLLLAISPWHLQLTRASFESSLSLLWVILALYLFIKGIEDKRFWLLVSAVSFAVAVYTYNSARVFAPLFIAFLLFFYIKKLWSFKKWAIGFCALFTLLLLPLVPFILSGAGSARYKLVSVADDKGLIPRINEHRGQSKLPQPLPKLVHNKITYLGFYYTENYLAHFTPQFLFISGAPHKQHHVQNMGELYWFQLPLLLGGLYFLFKKRHSSRWVIIVWILLSIVPVATTNDSIPHALRTLIAAPAYQLICGFGAVGIWGLLKGKQAKVLFSALMGGAVVICIGWYLYQYYWIYPKSYSRDWQYGNKQVVSYIKDRYQDYDLIVYSRTYGEPHMFTLFYLNYDPAKFQTNPNLNRYETDDWIWVLRFDKFYFPDLGDKGTHYEDILKANSGKKILFIGRQEDFPKQARVLERINFLNGNPAFVVTEQR